MSEKPPPTVCHLINTKDEGPEVRRTIESFRQHKGDVNLIQVVIADGTKDGSCDNLPDDVVVLKPEDDAFGIGQSKWIGLKVALEKFPEIDFIFHTDGHNRIIRGTVADMAREAMKNGPCIVTPALGPLNCVLSEECREHGKDSCQVDCPKIQDNNEVPYNCYQGGKLSVMKKGRFNGPWAEGTATRPKEKISRTEVVNPSCFGYTPETLKLLGGWNRYPGRWGSQEAGLSLKAWYADIPILNLRDDLVCVLHRYRSWNERNRSPYEVPRKDTAANTRYMLKVVSDLKTWEEVWQPWFDRQGKNEEADKLIAESHCDEQREAFAWNKNRTDREFFEKVVQRPWPTDLVMDPGAKRALLATSAGIGNVLLCVPAIKALHSMTGCEVDILDQGINHKGTVELLEKQKWVGKVYQDEPDLRFYRMIAGSFFGNPPPFIPKGTMAAHVQGGWRTRHEVELNMDVVRALGFEDNTPSIEIGTYDLHREFPFAFREYVVIAVGTSGYISKRYPYWKEVAIGLRNRGVNVAFVGGQEDSEPYMDAAGLNMCGKTSIAQAAGVISSARMYLGPDNGPSHLAAAVGTPSLLVYGPTHERKNRPWTVACRILRSDEYDCGACWGHPRKKPCDEKYGLESTKPCMKAIRPEWVIRETLRQINEPAWSNEDHLPHFYSKKQILANLGAEPRQTYEEMAETCRFLRRRQVTRILEIGTCTGGWIGVVGLMLGAPLDICSIDVEDHFLKVRQMLEKEGVNVTHIRANSQEQQTVDLVDNWTKDHGGLFDVIHIDGDHDYDPAKKDYELYKRFIRPGGLILIHDTHNARTTDVLKVFEEVRGEAAFWHDYYSEAKNPDCGGPKRETAQGASVMVMPRKRFDESPV